MTLAEALETLRAHGLTERVLVLEVSFDAVRVQMAASAPTDDQEARARAAEVAYQETLFASSGAS